jgi:hypothetical protein
VSGLGLRSTAFLGTTAVSVPSAPTLSFTDTYADFYEESGGSNEPNIIVNYRVFNLSWTSPTNNGSAITGYILESSTNGGSTWTTNSTYDASTNIADITILQNSPSFLVRIRATNAIGNGAVSNSLTIQYSLSNPGTPGFVPNKVILTGVYQSANTTLTVTWSAPPPTGVPLEYYQVQISYDGVNYGNLLTTSGLGCSTSGYTFGETYWFRVSATNAYGMGQYSDPSTGMVESYGPGYWD